jgi:1-acyl-sn-glycerol-3-phosphate acyltransferase
MNQTGQSPRSVRYRLISLWIALFAFSLGENVLRVFALFRLNSGFLRINSPLPLIDGSPPALQTGWLFWWLFLSAVPTIALAPLVGAVASSRFRWLGMLLAAISGLGIAILTGTSELPNWPACIGLLSLASIVFYANRYAIVPDAARQGHLSLPHLQAVMMLAVAAGAGMGIWLGYSEVAQRGMPLQLQAAHAGFGVAIIALLFARFQPSSEVSLGKGFIRPYLRTARAILTTRKSRQSLIGLSIVFVMLLALDQWLIPINAHLGLVLAVIIGLVVGGLHGNAYRTLGRVPFASIGLAACSIWGVCSGDWYAPGFGLAGFLGITIVPLMTTYQIHQPEESRGHGAALLFALCGLEALGLIWFLFALHRDPGAIRLYAGYGILALSLFALFASWLVFFRPALETFVEWVLWPCYRVRAYGAGAPLLPWRGPYIVIANHAAFFDPLWLEKILPAPMVPMMTSKYYDVRVISWFMRRVFGTIRVPDVALRRHAPELQQALAALDRGDVLVLFPEGYLRRKESQELRRFGRGIWEILKARPMVPVFACWIDGNWGSYVSYKDGPPIKNKKIDIWRPIRIAVAAPRVLDAQTLETHWPTRFTLMNAVLEARAQLGLPPIDPFKMVESEEEEQESDKG